MTWARIFKPTYGVRNLREANVATGSSSRGAVPTYGTGPFKSSARTWPPAMVPSSYARPKSLRSMRGARSRTTKRMGRIGPHGGAAKPVAPHSRKRLGADEPAEPSLFGKNGGKVVRTVAIAKFGR